MQLKRIKPYKSMSPEETIIKIRSVLENIGFHFIEKPTENNDLFSACTLSLLNPENNQVYFSTYGKGNSDGWASASAWGEMIERIQNLAFFMIFIYPSQPDFRKNTAAYKYFPDEKVFQPRDNEDHSLEKKIIELTGIEDISAVLNNEITCVPFWNFFDKATEYLPFRVIQATIGSNGMCSGNTKEEALIQGISEVFERHVLKTIYLNPISPPDIPLSWFEGSEIKNKIVQLTGQYGFEVQIKDCSLGKGYPVLGVLVKNDRNCYAFHLGADPCPITALERCFTEMFQGGSICFQSIDILKENMPFDPGSRFWKKELCRTIKAYAGQWPPSVLKDESTYEFQGFDHPESLSDHDDLEYLFGILKKDSRKLFIRDNSFLGHPSYYIYVPGMSEMTSIPDNRFLRAYLDFDKYLPVIADLKESTVNEREKMMDAIQIYIDASPENQFNTTDYFRYNQNHPVARLSPGQFTTLIQLSILEGNILDNFDIEQVKSNPFLNLLFEKDNSFKLAGLFDHLNIPGCFKCWSCLTKDNCNLPYINLLWEKIRVKMESYFLNYKNSVVIDDV
jgi:ribosomal protein S12 methylthiotransferase accessory factor